MIGIPRADLGVLGEARAIASPPPQPRDRTERQALCAELAKGMVERIEPWVEFCEHAIRKVIAGSPLEDALPVRELAYGMVSFYLGANLLTHLDSETQIDALFERVEAFTPAVTAVLRP